MAVNNTTVNLSEMLLDASEKGKDGMRQLLYYLDIGKVESLEKKVIKQFHELTDEQQKREYANNVILANNLPICSEFSRIICIYKSREKYVEAVKNNYKANNISDIFEEFIKYSDVLQDIRKRVFEKNDIISSRKERYRRH
ncbi:MAG: hypothetical protein IJ809_01330 [Clostridia bacterium]|nr:hypothetical protein [Clostridia bacterium]